MAMAIEEAISHARETSKRDTVCEECRQEHAQLADWLEELKMLRTAITPPSEWVSVEERLPEPGERVLAANGSFVGEAYLASNGTWMRHDGFPWVVDCWMPMPDHRPPEGEA